MVQILYRWLVAGETPERLDAAAEWQALAGMDATGGPVDEAYFRELLAETHAHARELDELLVPHLDRPLAEVDSVERAILRLGACELARHHEVPFRVVINEAVELAKRFGAEQSHRFVNGVLDKLALELRPLETGRKDEHGQSRPA